MRLRHVGWLNALLSLLVVLAFPSGLAAQQDKVAALKQSLAANQKQLRQYKWVETTVISMKGEEKSRIQKQCFYGADGKVQKQQLSAPPQQAAPGGLKGKAVAKKKEEITAAMNQAVDLVEELRAARPAAHRGHEGRRQSRGRPIGPEFGPAGPPQLCEGRRHAQPRPGHRSQRAPDRQREVVPRIQGGGRHPGRDLRPAPRRPVLPGQHRAQRAEAADAGGDPELQLREGHAGGPGSGAAGQGRARLDDWRVHDGHGQSARPDRALPRCPDCADSHGVDRRCGPAEVRRLVGEQRQPQGECPPGRGAEGRVRRLLCRARAVPAGGQDDGREAGLDPATGQGVHDQQERRLRVHPAPARGGAGHGQPDDHRAAGGGEPKRRPAGRR